MAASGFAKEHLVTLISRVTRLEDEKDALGEDIKEVYAEAKGQGFDTKILRETVRRNRMDKAERQEHDALQELYESAANMR